MLRDSAMLHAYSVLSIPGKPLTLERRLFISIAPLLRWIKITVDGPAKRP